MRFEGSYVLRYLLCRLVVVVLVKFFFLGFFSRRVWGSFQWAARLTS